ncbi:MAG: hypothetical protein LBI28_14900 [Treponema sp.]|jgi:hypothetical protein|nr:hypothetical protein [Treponema sp.]
MKIRYYIFFYIVLILLFSCVKEKIIDKSITVIEQRTINNLIIPNPYPATTEKKEEIKEFLYKNEALYNRYYGIGQNLKINFIERVNFGIPGGDNWIVRIEPHSNNERMQVYIFVIDGDNIVKTFLETVNRLPFWFDTEAICKYDIMEDIPGMHIPNGNISIGDFNDDGIFELFNIFYDYYLGHNVDIFYYDSEKDGFVFSRIYFGLIDPINGPAPVEFINYNGTNGIKVYYDHRWRFYVWDIIKREYEEVVEISNEMNIGYNIHNFQIGYFWSRIESVMETNMSTLENVVEIDPKFEGGRSFMATIRSYDNTYWESRHDFYPDGKWYGWYTGE